MNRLDSSVNHWDVYEAGQAMGLGRKEIKSLANKEVNAISNPLAEISHANEDKLGSYNQSRSDKALKAGTEKVYAVLKEMGYDNICQAINDLGVDAIKEIANSQGAQAVNRCYEKR